MNTLLAIETSADFCTVALEFNNEILLREARGLRSHSENLLPFVQSLLQESRQSLAELDAIAFSAGPGSFTGIRIAASVVKALAYVADKPVIPISSLEVNAQSFFRTNVIFNEVTVINDARMGEVYLGHYRKDSLGLSIADSPDQLIRLNALTPSELQQTVATGDARHLMALNENLAAQPFIEQSPHALDVLALSKRYLANALYTDAIHAEPVYLRGKSSWKTLQEQKKTE